jgi:hypothetical protein
MGRRGVRRRFQFRSCLRCIDKVDPIGRHSPHVVRGAFVNYLRCRREFGFHRVLREGRGVDTVWCASIQRSIQLMEFPLKLKFIAAGCGIICLSVLCFAAGVAWSTMPRGTKPQPVDPQPVVAQRTKDDQEEVEMTRRAVLTGFESIGIVKQFARRQRDLTLTVAPSFKAIDQKSKTNVCEMVYCYLLMMPRAYNLSEYDYVLNLKDGETGKNIGVYNPKTGLRLDQ